MFAKVSKACRLCCVVPLVVCCASRYLCTDQQVSAARATCGMAGNRKPRWLVCVIAGVLLTLMLVALGVTSRVRSRSPRVLPPEDSSGTQSPEESGTSSQEAKPLEPLRLLPGRCLAGDAAHEMPPNGPEDEWMFAPVERASLGKRARRFCSLALFRQSVLPFPEQDVLKDVFPVLSDTRDALDAARSGRQRNISGVSVLFNSIVPDAEDWLEPFLLVDRILPALGMARAGMIPPVSAFVFNLPPSDFGALLRRHGGLIEGLVRLVASEERGDPAILNLADSQHQAEVLVFEEVLYFTRQGWDNYQGRSLYSLAGFPSFEAGAALRRAAYAQCGVPDAVSSMRGTRKDNPPRVREPPRTALLVRHRVSRFRQFGPNVLDLLRTLVKSVEVYVEDLGQKTDGFCDVVRIFSRADVIVSAYGSQLVPALFAHDGAHIVELFPKRFRSPAFEMLGSEYGRDIQHTSVYEGYDWETYYGCEGSGWEMCHRAKLAVNLTVNSDSLRQAITGGQRRQGTGRRLVVARSWGGGLGHKWAELSPALIAAQRIGAEFVYDPVDLEEFLCLGRNMKQMTEVLSDPSLRHVQLAYQAHVVPDGYEPKDLGLIRLTRALEYYEDVLDPTEDVVYVLARGQNCYSHCESKTWLREKYWETRTISPAKCFLRDDGCLEKKYRASKHLERLNIVAHVRRGNAVGIDWRLLSCEYFRELLDNIFKALPKDGLRYVDIHMMCEDSIEWFSCMREHPVLGQSTAFIGHARNESAMPFPRVDMFLHLRTPLVEDFHTMVAGDVFITSKSSMSEVGAMISHGVKMVVPFWHALDCDDSYIAVDEESRTFDEALLTRKIADMGRAM